MGVGEGRGGWVLSVARFVSLHPVPLCPVVSLLRPCWGAVVTCY